MELEIANKIISIGKRSNEHLEEFLKIQNELYEITNGLSEEEIKELVAFSESNEFLQTITARNVEIFNALGWLTE